jgi:hypothetical protein
MNLQAIRELSQDNLQRYLHERFIERQTTPPLLDNEPREAVFIEALGDEQPGDVFRDRLAAALRAELKFLGRLNLEVWSVPMATNIVACVMFLIATSLPELLPEVEEFAKLTTTDGMFHTFKALKLLRK